MVYYIEKIYSNFKAAHRQWRDVGGHCSGVHGENWTFTIQVSTDTLNDKNFVVGFGELREVRDFLERHFDHVTLLDEDDPLMSYFVQLHEMRALKLVVLPSACSEGIAAFIANAVRPIIHRITDGRARLSMVKVTEDEKNSATLLL